MKDDRVIVPDSQPLSTVEPDKREKKYWLTELSGRWTRAEFPPSGSGKPHAGSESGRLPFSVPDDVFSRLMRISGGSDAKLHVMLTAAAALLLARYTGDRDFLIGVPIYRQEEEGRFVNTMLAVRFILDPELSFKDLIVRTHRKIFEASEHQNYPLETLAYLLNLPDFQDGNALFDVVVLLENVHHPDYFVRSRPGFVFSFKREENRLFGTALYRTGRYSASDVDTIVRNYLRLIDKALSAAMDPWSTLEFVGADERERLLRRLLETASRYPQDQTLPDLISRRASSAPDSLAIVEDDTRQLLTYRLLLDSVGRLAGRLRELGVSDGTLVGILAERSLPVVISILGVMHAGGTYVPLDPAYPTERIRFILKDSGTDILLTTPGDPDPEDGKWPGRVIDISRISIPENTALKEPSANPSSPAYVIYTSGTTGRPKGVVVEQRNLVSLFVPRGFRFHFDDRDTWVLFHSHCFDFSVWEIFGPLVYGARLVVISRADAIDPSLFLNILLRHHVNILNQTPSAFYNLIGRESGRKQSDLNLKYVIFGGERLAPGRLREWRRRYPATRLINMFGITEITVHATFKEVTSTEIEADESNIGTAIPAADLFILDEGMNLLPAGIAGELYVSGGGVARGYLNRPRLTAERFLRNPFKTSERLYRSGDVVYGKTDGDVVYIGRNDQQFQFHGYRIEPREIENRLLEHRQITAAVVVKRGESQDEEYLCGYYAAERELPIAELRGLLNRSLPDYMIPGYFVRLDRIPLTANQKVDLRALPLPTHTGEGTYQAPRTPAEEKMAAIWAEVLKADRVSVTDSFFHIGGDSIRAIKLLSLINDAFNTELHIVDLFTEDTIEALALKLEKVQPPREESASLESEREIDSLKEKILSACRDTRRIEDIYPMSDIEKGMAYLSLRDPDAALYHDQLVYQLRFKEFDPVRLKAALALLAARHPILRTAFDLQGHDEEVQIVYKEVSIDYEHRDISDQERPRQRKLLESFLEDDRRDPFNLVAPPLWRLRTFDLGDDLIQALWIFHHAILDGWSNASFITELNNTYLKLKEEPDFIPEPLACSYRDFVVAERMVKKSGKTADFWRRELTDYRRLDLLAAVGTSQSGDLDSAKYDPGIFIRRYDPEFVKKMEAGTGRLHTGIKSLCLAAYFYTLNIFSFENDIIAGVVTHNRPVKRDGDRVLGCFLNSVPLRLRIHDSMTWWEYLSMVDRKILVLKEFERLPMLEIARLLGEDTRSRNPFFDCLFNFVDFHVYSGAVVERDIPEDNEAVVGGYENTNTLFDFTVNTTLGGFTLVLYYASGIFDSHFMERFCEYFYNSLRMLLDSPDLKLSKESVMPDSEKRELLAALNQEDSPFPAEKDIPTLFREQVEMSPDHIALVDHLGTRCISYCFLNEASRGISRYLCSRGVGVNHIVGIVVERSLEWLISLMGILKAGGAYLPINPNNPKNRVTFMLKDCASRWLVSRRELISGLDITGKFLDLEEIFSDLLYGSGSADFVEPTPLDSRRLAYIVYTSGSSGKPKGAFVPHRSLVNYCWWHTRFYEVGNNDRTTQLAEIGFDAAVWEYYPYVFEGASVYIVPDDVKLDMARLNDFFEMVNITIMFMITPMYEQFMELENHSLRLLQVGGEKLRHYTKRNYRLVNNYGPTECTVVTLAFPIRGDYHSVPIGGPVSNNHIFVLGRNGRLQPPGTPGELCISGESVSMGYANRVELTALKFVPDPFDPGRRMYCTGDLVRRLPDGNIDYLSRIDQQVKIRGFRIELEEIERRLLTFEGIDEAVVITVNITGHGSDETLCAYVSGQKEMDEARLIEHLAAELPSHMVPARFIFLPVLPLTPSGKIDRRALPLPAMAVQPPVRPPEGPTSEALAGIWADILKIDQELIGEDSNFFELGGHSLRVTRLVGRLHKTFKVKVPISRVFTSPTIESLARYIEDARRDNSFPLEPAEKREWYPLSPAQRSLFTLEQGASTERTYNVPIIVELEGSPDRDRIMAALTGLIERHDSLRSSFVMIDDLMIQKIDEEIPLAPKYMTAHENDYLDILENCIRPFDLGRPPLFRIVQIEMPGQRLVLVFDMHHIITDGVSTDILINEFSALYQGKALPPLRLQYKDYALWLNGPAGIQMLRRQETFWMEQFGGKIPQLQLANDFPRPPVRSFEGDSIQHDLGPKLTGRLRRLAGGEKVTLYMLLLAVFNITLSKMCGQEDIIVGTVASGRQQSGLEEILGLFVNMLAIRTFPAESKSFREYLGEVKVVTLKAFENQDYHFETLVKKLNCPIYPGRNPLFDVAFNFYTLDNQPGEIPGLEMRTRDFQTGNSKFDIVFAGLETKNSLLLNLDFCVKLFTRETVERYIGYFLEITETILENPGIRLEDVAVSHGLLKPEISVLQEDEGDFVF